MVATRNLYHSLTTQTFAVNRSETSLFGSISELAEVIASHSKDLPRVGDVAGMKDATGCFLHRLESAGDLFRQILARFAT